MDKRFVLVDLSNLSKREFFLSLLSWALARFHFQEALVSFSLAIPTASTTTFVLVG